MARGQGLNSEIMAGADRLDPPRLGGTRRNGPDMNDLFAFFPAIFAQSSGFVVFGKSSCSLNSSRIARSRSSALMPFAWVAMTRLIAYFFARETIPSINAPLAKSLK